MGKRISIPFHRPLITDDEINEVVDTLRSGWLTTGPKTKQFEREFAQFVGAKHAIALNSATAALHLALEAVGIKRGDAVLVPTMTFASTAEVVRYFDATPVLMDCRGSDLNLDVDDAARQAAKAKGLGLRLRAIIPVHYGGQMVDMDQVRSLADKLQISVIEDAAHCCPAFFRPSPSAAWRAVGQDSDVACYSFYANKCITTGEGGMACTDNDQLAERIRIMSLHGISKDAWKRFTTEGSWYYEIISPGYKYNLTDVAAAIGIHQLRKANRLRAERAKIAEKYQTLLADVSSLELPFEAENRVHSWHLFVVKLRLEMLAVGRAEIIEKLKGSGIGASVHWIPLHMHPYYRQEYGYVESDYPSAAAVSRRTISLPIYPGMNDEEIAYVVEVLRGILSANRK